MLDWLIDFLVQTYMWTIARSAVEVLLFLILLCLWSISGKLAGILSAARAANAISATAFADAAQKIIDNVEQIRIHSHHTMDAAIDSNKAMEELRERLAPRSYEVERHDY